MSDGWEATYPGAADDMSGPTDWLAYGSQWLSGEGQGRGAVDIPCYVVAALPSLYDSSSSQLPPSEMIGFSWQRPQDQ